MKVIVNQNVPPNVPTEVKVSTVCLECNFCYSILEIERADLLEGADQHGTWFYVKCQACGRETGVRGILEKRLK